MTDATIPHKTWKFDEGHYIAATDDGDRMTGGPTDGYWKVHATHRVSGYVTMGRGETYLEALIECVKHANEKDAAAASVAGTFCELMGYPLTDIHLYQDEAAKHIAWHKALKKHGEFYQ